MVNQKISVDEFIQSYAKLLSSWGMPLTAARVLAYLLLQPRPVGLDQIAADLGMSKAGAWGATRHLERVHQIERFGEPGSKRALFAPVENFARSLFSYSRLLSKGGELLNASAAVAAGPEASARLLERAEFYLAVHEAIERTMQDLMAKRQQKPKTKAKSK